VRDVKTAYLSVGAPAFRPTKSEESGLNFRRSIYIVADMAAGDKFTAETVRSIRPSKGLAPKYLDSVLGRRATRAVRRGEALAEDMIEGGLDITKSAG
jgi:sialic acid synthase SpsE